MKYRIVLIVSVVLLSCSVTAFAVEVAPRISDREIVEKLAKLEAGQAALGQTITDLRIEMRAGQGALRTEMKEGQDAFRAEMKEGQDALRAEMKEGQDALRAEMKDGRDALRAEMRVSDDAIRSEMKSGYAALGKRIDDLHSMILAMFTAMVTLIVALFAYIAWDRRTMLKPVVERLDHLEREVLRDLDMGNKDGSLLTRLVLAMREIAKDNEKVAAALRSFSLL